MRLELVPELEYGQPRHNWVADHGTLRLDAGRPRKVYDEMAFAATLAPGHMLVLASLPNRPGSLGHSFFTESAGGRLEQKLLILRLSQTQHDDLFAHQEIPPAQQ